MSKRQKFVISSLLLAVTSFFVQYVGIEFRYWAILGLSLFSLVISFWALREGLTKSAVLLSLVLPVFFTVGAQLFFLGFESSSNFYLLLPGTLAVGLKVLFNIGFAVGLYALFLTGNIYNVATARTIQLLRAAHAVGFVLSLATCFFLFNWLLGLRTDFYVNSVGMGLLSIPLFLQGFWSIELEDKLSKEIIYFTVSLSLLVAEFAMVLSFWPITVPVASLTLTSVVYIGLGIGQAKLQQRLFEKTVREYLIVGLLVFSAMFLTARWGG